MMGGPGTKSGAVHTMVTKVWYNMWREQEMENCKIPVSFWLKGPWFWFVGNMPFREDYSIKDSKLMRQDDIFARKRDAHMATIFDVARYILDKIGDVSAWKLQKLCYYSQAWSLAWTDKPLFEEDFEAWRNGPVCPQLYQVHKGQFIVRADGIMGSAAHLSEDQKETIDVVLQHYGNWEPYRLVEQTHHDDPWKNARGDLPADAICNTVITKESMGAFYGGL